MAARHFRARYSPDWFTRLFSLLAPCFSLFLEFKSGQITTIDGELGLDGAGAHVADASTTGSNSALTGLASVTDEFSLRTAHRSRRPAL